MRHNPINNSQEFTVHMSLILATPDQYHKLMQQQPLQRLRHC